MGMRDEHIVDDVKRAFARRFDPFALAVLLGREEGAKRQPGGVAALCLWHLERSPSLSITIGPEGHHRLHCFACSQTWNALQAIAQARGVDFPAALAEAAALVGIDLGAASTRHQLRAAPAPARTAPLARPRIPNDERNALWGAAYPANRTLADLTESDLAAAWMLARRRWYAPALAALDLVRLLPLPSEFSAWPSWWPSTWADCWRLAALAYEPDGTPASIHARAVYPDASPKDRWPLGGERYSVARGLFFADAGALSVLRGAPPRDLEAIVLCEGITDWIATSLAVADEGAPMAVLGGASGSWPALARVKWPQGCPAIVAVDADAAGEKYAAQIRAALPRTVEIRRWRADDKGAA
jgi:hypothetical protein